MEWKRKAFFKFVDVFHNASWSQDLKAKVRMQAKTVDYFLFTDIWWKCERNIECVDWWRWPNQSFHMSSEEWHTFCLYRESDCIAVGAHLMRRRTWRVYAVLHLWCRFTAAVAALQVLLMYVTRLLFVPTLMKPVNPSQIISREKCFVLWINHNAVNISDYESEIIFTVCFWAFSTF